MIRAALYDRDNIHNARQDFDNQICQLREFAARQGWEIVAEYVDHAVDGEFDRVEFKRLFSDVAKDRFDVLVFWALDRLTREGTLETLKCLDELSKCGVGFRSLTEPYLDSCGALKDAVIAILAIIAKQERVRISERATAALARAKEKGTRTGRSIGRPRAVFSREQALELRRSGLPWRQIASKLHAGVTTVRRACKDAGTKGGEGEDR